MLEFIYTSAPETLDGPGYGAVAKSENFPSDLEKFVRKLCRYEFLSNSFGSGAVPYPKVHSHAIFQRASERWHVLSRVECAGLDYTQRFVFLASHVVLTSAELATTSVTELLQQSDLFHAEWKGAPRVLAPKTLRRQPPARPATVNPWKQAAGDAQWGKIWAQKWRSSRNEPRFLVFPADFDPLPLYLESLSLLPADQAAQTAFITHLASDHHGPSFEWIGLIAKTELAVSIERNSKDRVMNLTRPLGSPTQALLDLDEIDAAPPATATPAKKAAKTEAIVRPAEEDPSSPQYIPDEYRQPAALASWGPNAAGATQDPSDTYRLQTTPNTKSKKTSDSSGGSLPNIPVNRQAALNQNPLSKYLVVGGIVAVLAIGLIVWISRQATVRPKSESPPKVDQPIDDQNPASDDKSNGPKSDNSGELAKNQQTAAEAKELNPEAKSPSQNPVAVRKNASLQKPIVESTRFVSQGLKETWQKSGAQPGKLLDSVAELKRVGLRATLVSGLGLKGTSKAEASEPTLDSAVDSKIDLVVTGDDEPTESLHLLVAAGAVSMQVPATTSPAGAEKLIRRLRFANLDIESSTYDPEPFVIHLAFNCPLEGVPTNGLKGAEPTFKVSGEDASSFFESLRSASIGQVKCVLKINRVSLSLLPGTSAGWALSGVEASTTDFPAPLEREFRLAPSGAALVGSLKVATNFDPDKTEKPVLSAELAFPVPAQPVVAKPNEQGPQVGEDAIQQNETGTKEIDEPQVPTKPNAAKGKPAKPAGAAKGVDKKSNDQKSKNGNSKSGQPNSTPAADENSTEVKNLSNMNDASMVERLPELADAPLLNELFRRYGRVHAEFVVRIPRQNGESTPVFDDRNSVTSDANNKNKPQGSREFVVLRIGD